MKKHIELFVTVTFPVSISAHKLATCDIDKRSAQITKRIKKLIENEPISVHEIEDMDWRVAAPKMIS